MSLAGVSCFSVLLLILFHSEHSSAETETPLMKNFDFEKYSKTQWWVSYRNNVLDRYDHCIALSFGKFFDDEKMYKRTDHLVHGNIDTSYQPVTPHDNGYYFLIEDGLEARVDCVHTDYSTYSIVEVFLKNSTHTAEDHLAVLTKQQMPSEDDIRIIDAQLGEIFTPDLQISNLTKVNNVDCPFDKQTRHAL